MNHQTGFERITQTSGLERLKIGRCQWHDGRENLCLPSTFN